MPTDPGRSGNSFEQNSLPSKAPDKADNTFAHLPEHEAAILKRQLDVRPVKVSYKDLYRYATKLELLILASSSICAIAAGAALPITTILYGSLAGTFQDFFLGKVTGATFSNEIGRLSIYFVYLAIGEFVTCYLATVGFIYIGERISGKVRKHYLASILRQNVGFFDKLGAGEITTRITADTNLIQDGISQKVALTLQAVASFATAYVVAYIKYWKLALVLTSTIVAIFATSGGFAPFIAKWNKQSLSFSTEGGTVVEEVISSVRNIVAFGSQERHSKEYDKHLDAAERFGFKARAATGSMLGFMMCYIYLTYALAFWAGSRFLVNGECSLADILTILLSIMMGAFALGNVLPNAQAFSTAVAAASKIYSTIDRSSPLDPCSQQGVVLQDVRGSIELHNIKHIYPSRPDVVVLDDVDLSIPAGRTTALVGTSGSGKSTIVNLVERFYDPVAGEITLDDVNIQTLNLGWLRQQVSLVSQEPTLFATTVANNIQYGLLGTKYEHLSPNQLFELIQSAAMMANAHEFILRLPNQYETNVGEGGLLLSGGQKQRIAIARAVISNPKILLLDEATSALDTKSEGIVQEALDKAAEGRTTIIIAHRLSTVKNADNIVVMSKGRISEQGTHEELIERQGTYHNLVEAQKIAQENETQSSIQRHDDSITIGNDKEAFDDIEVFPNSAKSGLVQSKESKAVSFQGEMVSRHSIWQLIRVVSSFNRQEWHYMFLGLFFAIIAGAGTPVQAVLFAKSVSSLSLPSTSYDQLRLDINFWSWMYFMLAMVQLLSYLIDGIAFAWCSEKLVHRARIQSFRAILRQDVAFFDRDENSAGGLTSFLSTETTHLAGVSGVTLGTILSAITTLVVGFAIALPVGWKLSLVCIATVPIVLLCGFLRVWMLARFQTRAKGAYKQSASYACEATSAIRTVASLTKEAHVLQQYYEQLVNQEAKSLHSVLQSSTLYAASQSLTLCCSALGFWYGGVLIGKGEYSLFQFFLCFSAIIFGAQSAGIIFSFAPDISKAKYAASEIKTLMDQQPAIDTWCQSGKMMTTMQGSISFENVHFQYPSRPGQPVLQGLDLQVLPGQYAAIVGSSGCGKSTTISMLERFYDPSEGSIMVDAENVAALNVNSYRSHLALVAQEPTLYQGTIRDNILLGASTNETIPEDEIVQACKDANIYEFILSLPDGLDTSVGSKGCMLSGGQKQRIAIARALIRNPKILLLDEATSALDSESEKVVQAALDKAAEGRTTIAVAHRLSTIQKADIIFVMDRGRIVESGTHNELIAERGRYYELVCLQNLNKP